MSDCGLKPFDVEGLASTLDLALAAVGQARTAAVHTDSLSHAEHAAEQRRFRAAISRRSEREHRAPASGRYRMERREAIFESICEKRCMVHTQSLSLLPRNGHSVPFVEVRQSLPSKVAAISPFADQLMRFILNFRSADGSETDIEMALHEALANAVIHGNGENSRKRVYVACRCYMDGEVSITVRDERRGFDSNAIPAPTLRGNVLFTYGRGIYLMKTSMDEISLEEGAVVTIRKKSNASSAPEREPK